jgi:type III pantothenate kinase
MNAARAPALLIDAGNTRIKWGVVRQSEWLAEGVVPHDQAAVMGQVAIAQPGLARVLCANVAGADAAARIAAALQGLAPTIEWVQSAAQCCGVRNLYEQPTQLGVDRWAALIGARAAHRATCLVVTAGTATTIDMLDADGVFTGGLILPGEDLMRRSLARDTAQLPLAEGHFREAPRNTADAIVSGCRAAQVGAITRMFERIAHTPDALCLLNGGAAARIEKLLAIPFRRIDNLVLKGLARMAESDTKS